MANKKYSITLNGVAHEVVIAPQGSDDYAVTVDGELFNVTATTLSLEDISNHIVGLSENSFVYTGEEIRPTVLTDGTVTEGIDYNLIYSNNIEVGTGTVSVIGNGNYEGTVSLSFSITSSEEVTETPVEEDNTSTDTSSGTSTEEPVVSDDENVTVKENEETVTESTESTVEESPVVNDDENVTVEENLEENSNEEAVTTESTESTTEESSVISDDEDENVTVEENSNEESVVKEEVATESEESTVEEASK